MSNQARINEALKLLRGVLEAELLEVIEKMLKPGGLDELADSWRIEFPKKNIVDAHIDDLASLVARSANNFYSIARLLGKAKAMQGSLEDNYKRKFKASQTGSNTAAREKAAVEATEDEFKRLDLITMLCNFLERQEASARIASETARKLLDKVGNMDIASRRESAGSFKNEDFNW